MFLLLYVQLFCNAGDNYIQRNIMQAYVILFFTSMIAGRPLIVSLVDDEGCEVKLVQRSVPSRTPRKDWTVLALLISSMIRKELGHQYAVVAAGNSRAVTTTAVGKGRRDDKGFREALTTLAAGAGCRDQGGPPPRSSQGDNAWGKKRGHGREGAATGATGRDLYVICKIRLDPFSNITGQH